MGRNNYFKPGDWNFVCDICGFPYKSSQATLGVAMGGVVPTLRVCQTCRDPVNPQDFVRPRTDPSVIPWSRPMPPNNFVDPDASQSVEWGHAMDVAPMDSGPMG